MTEDSLRDTGVIFMSIMREQSTARIIVAINGHVQSQQSIPDLGLADIEKEYTKEAKVLRNLGEVDGWRTSADGGRFEGKSPLLNIPSCH